MTTGIETTPMMVPTRAASYPCDRITPEVKNTVSETVSGSGDNGPIHGRKGFREHIYCRSAVTRPTGLLPGSTIYSLSGVGRGGANRESTTVSSPQSPSQSHAAIWS